MDNNKGDVDTLWPITSTYFCINQSVTYIRCTAYASTIYRDIYWRIFYIWNKMLVVKEVLLFLVIIAIQQSVQQTSTMTSTKYEKVTVESNSFNSIRITSLTSQGWVWGLEYVSYIAVRKILNITSAGPMPFFVPPCVRQIPTVKFTTLRLHNALKLMLMV